MKAFEHAGFWWDPRDPETRWPGTLRFDPVEGAALRRTMPFHPSQLFPEGREFPVLLGETTGTGKITLLHCFEQGPAEVFANAVIVGFHASEPDPPILIAAAVMEHLDDWWGKSAISHDESLTSPDVGMRYTQPPPVEVHADASMRTVIHSGALPEFESARASIAEEIRIELTAQEPRGLSAFFKSAFTLARISCRSHR